MKQSQAEEILKTGQNVLLTGPAGCGKTFLLNKYIAWLKKKKVKVAVTASTGIASTHLNGRTIHSWCRIGIADSMTDSQVKKTISDVRLLQRVRATDSLIIDEISMLNANRLDLVNRICQAIRQDLRPFGGMQLILCGDFFQLPPVARGEEDSRFVTESAIWKEMDLSVCYINEQYRQSDQQFLQVLNDIRNNTASQQTFDILQTRLDKEVKAKIQPTKLHTHNLDVDIYNNRQLEELPGPQTSFAMVEEGIPQLVKELKRNCLAHETLNLKVGAVVMFIKNNMAKKYVNGTLGKVVGFDPADGYPVIATVSGQTITANPESWAIEDDDKIIAKISQVPLRLAWAITVHKSQGMSLDCAEIDLSRTFEYGMGYVALSRVRSLAGIKLSGINELAFEVNKQAVILDSQLRRKSTQNLQKFTKAKKTAIKKKQRDFLKSCQVKNEFPGLN
ncbi:AAA family ATPase [Patescibacteria group bacterium]|nr:AAA family ATPase [Patescibacteria group bacterium]